MAGQTPSRRQVVQALACAAVASGAPGFVQWSYAFGPADGSPQSAHHHTHASGSTATHAVYKPRFFTAPEYATVVVLAELILPRTGNTPLARHAASGSVHHGKVSPADAGATDAGVAEFIDFMVAEDPQLHDGFRDGLAWMNGAAAPATFIALPLAAQTGLLTRLAYRKNFRPEDKPGQEFFALMRRYTVMGFYTTEIGLKQLDYPGLQFYAESPSVPNDGSLAKVLA